MIVFILPMKENGPVGGYKIAYEYAELFSKDGFDSHVLYPRERKNFFLKGKKNLFFKIKDLLGFYYRRQRKELNAGEWFKFEYPVKKDFVYTIRDIHLKHYSKDTVFFATSVETAYELNDVKSIPDNNKFYLIQDFENWKQNTDEYVLNSYKFNMHKIVISTWLQEKVMSTGNNAVVIPNGLDFDYFKLSNPIETRSKYEIAMLYHLDDRKRCCDSMAALKFVKEKIPELHVTMFGVPDKPKDLPDWYSYYKTPDKETHNKIYNNASIFVAASSKEGWALPPAEALQCGAALICTDIGGFAGYAINNETALTFPVFNVKKLADNIISLIENDSLRIKIATQGNKYIQRFTWEKSYALMKQEVEKYCGTN